MEQMPLVSRSEDGHRVWKAHPSISRCGQQEQAQLSCTFAIVPKPIEHLLVVEWRGGHLLMAWKG